MEKTNRGPWRTRRKQIPAPQEYQGGNRENILIHVRIQDEDGARSNRHSTLRRYKYNGNLSFKAYNKRIYSAVYWPTGRGFQRFYRNSYAYGSRLSGRRIRNVYVSAYNGNRVHGTLLKLRKDMFDHMQKLPVKFFDQRTHGEIMSRYTNDIDSMRELLSQGIPQLINSSIRVTGVFIMMIVISPILTLLAVVMLAVMMLVVKVLMKKSGFYFRRRQKALGEVNGYIEEMIEGQKVVKVFCHEEEVREDFDVLNAEVESATASANTWASILMPIMGNLSHFHYAASAAIGGLMAIAGMLDIGSIASFLQYCRQFSMPITQLSQQFNSAMSALAGAERIFELIDAPIEDDDGVVTLVNAREGLNGTLSECSERTGIWAWKVPDASADLSSLK